MGAISRTYYTSVLYVQDWNAVLRSTCCCRLGPGPILSTGDIYREDHYRQRGMFQTASPPSGTPCCKSSCAAIRLRFAYIKRFWPFYHAVQIGVTDNWICWKASFFACWGQLCHLLSRPLKCAKVCSQTSAVPTCIGSSAKLIVCQGFCCVELLFGNVVCLCW